jgi:hypothetical protein
MIDTIIFQGSNAIVHYNYYYKFTAVSIMTKIQFKVQLFVNNLKNTNIAKVKALDVKKKNFKLEKVQSYLI